MIALLIVIYSICGIYMFFDLKHDFHMLQQNSYRISRYWKYLRKNDLADTWRLCDIGLLFIICSRLIEINVAAVFVGIYCIVKMCIISRRTFKKPLVITKRIIRLYITAMSIFIGLFLWSIFILGFKPETDIYYSGPIIVLSIFLLMTFFSWILVIVSVIILKPVEKMINDKFIRDAENILKSMPDLTVIGITGSYGKTSTKHFLERILSEKYNVLMTPGSYNTPLGVVRTIREQMKPFYSVFICEMGAKQKGDIKEICDIVHPRIGIITSVGPMHLETFKNIKNVRDTKFELIDALPQNGIGVVNNGIEEIRNRDVINVECIRYNTSKEGNTDDYYARDITYSPEGTEFKLVCPAGEILQLKTMLVGSGNIANLIAAIIVALKMDLSIEEIKRGVLEIKPVEHRLSIKKTNGGVTILDDAFNSNPEGSKMALDVLKEFRGGKRIIVTPGMIELGDQQHDLNKNFGKFIADSTDIAIIVGQYNRDSIIEGIEEGSHANCKVIVAENFKEAQQILSGLLEKGDTVLYENDLPDLFK